MTDPRIYQIIDARIKTAADLYGPIASTHEALGVLNEECAELLTAIHANDAGAIRREACDAAAVLIRLAEACASPTEAFAVRSGFTPLMRNDMSEYHKIQSIFKRDMATKHKTMLEGQWALPEFEFLAGNQWVFTEKVDGTNIRVIFKDGGITFGGRTADAQIPPQLVTRLNERFLPLAAKMAEVFSGDAVLYGEGYGAKIQKGGGNYRADQDLVLFDVRVGEWWLQRGDVEDVAGKLGLDAVPIIGSGTLHDAVAMAKAGIRSTWGDFEAEGIVARPATELFTRAGERLIAKIKCRDFQRS